MSTEDYIGVACPICGRMRLLLDGYTHYLRCEKCGATRDEIFDADPVAENARLREDIGQLQLDKQVHLQYADRLRAALSRSQKAFAPVIAALETVDAGVILQLWNPSVMRTEALAVLADPDSAAAYEYVQALERVAAATLATLLEFLAYEAAGPSVDEWDDSDIELYDALANAAAYQALQGSEA